MAKVGAQRAAELTGVSKSTIQRAMTAGKLSFELDSNQRRLVDVSELERVFGLKSQNDGNNSASTGSYAGQAATGMELELEKARHALEVERLKMDARMAQEQLENALTQIEDLKVQRDLWQKQAQQILITSQYSQKQSEERITEMRDREEARARAVEQRRNGQSGVVQHAPQRTATAQPQKIQPQQSNAPTQATRPVQGTAANTTSVGPQSATQSPIFRTVQPGNQNRSVDAPQKQSLFASLFGGNKKRTGTN